MSGGRLPWSDDLPARLALFTGAILAAVLLLVAAGSYAYSAMTMRRAFDDALRARAESAIAAFAALPDVLHEIEERRGRYSLWGDLPFVQALDAAGRVILTSTARPPMPVEPDRVRAALANGAAYSDLLLEDGRLRVRTDPPWLRPFWPEEGAVRVLYVALRARGGPPFLLQVGVPVPDLEGALFGLLRWVAGLAAFALAAVAASVAAMAGRAFAPLRAIIATAESIDRGTLSRRIETRADDRTLRRLVDVLNRMLDRLQAAFAAQSRFVDDAAHELRTPVSALRAELEVALRRPRSAEEYRAVLQSAAEEAERLGRLADDLLTLARHDRGGGPARREPVELSAAAARVLREVGALAERAGVTVASDVPAGLAAVGDALAIERALGNLVRNGIQHTPPGGSVTVRARREPRGMVRVEVADTGAGIPPDALPHIFERFYRVDAARTRAPAGAGTGLGLAIVKAIADAHGGRIEVRSAPGKGSTFILTLPAAAGDA